MTQYQIALFSAVLTAFLIPAIQNLFPSSGNTPSDSPPPLPDISLQNVCILNYLALILAVRGLIEQSHMTDFKSRSWTLSYLCLVVSG